jgi:pterin-4a-carbinolamine dehydratase
MNPQMKTNQLMNKFSYTGKQFIFHIFKTKDNNVEISLSSHYVNPPISRKELEELAKFIDSFIESGE